MTFCRSGLPNFFGLELAYPVRKFWRGPCLISTSVLLNSHAVYAIHRISPSESMIQRSSGCSNFSRRMTGIGPLYHCHSAETFFYAVKPRKPAHSMRWHEFQLCKYPGVHPSEMRHSTLYFLQRTSYNTAACWHACSLHKACRLNVDKSNVLQIQVLDLITRYDQNFYASDKRTKILHRNVPRIRVVSPGSKYHNLEFKVKLIQN